MLYIKDTGNPPQTHCIMYLSGWYNGAWSNATHKLTFSNTPVNYRTHNGASCPVAGVPSGTGTVRLTGTYTLTNTTNPAVPITVQP